MELFFENNQSGNGGFILLKNETEEVGRLTYTIIPNMHMLVISYVMVHAKFEGHGYGKKLVDFALEFARENHWKLKAHCSFAHTLLMRMENLEDVFIA